MADYGEIYKMAFKKFGLLPELIKAIEEKGYTEPTTIQAQANPLKIDNCDIKTGSQPGTVKKAIEEKGYTEPTTIQAQAIPLILEGCDILAGSQTGTGKTAGFTL